MWAALFPGQGSQTVGMGKFLYENFAIARETFEEASDTLKLDFQQLCFEGPENELQLTENTQPALLLVSTATFRVVAATIGVHIEAAAGHSVGEYAAAVTSAAISFSDAIRAVRIRGQAMQKAVPVGQGGMAAVLGLTDEQVSHLCRWAEQESGLLSVEPANFNAPGQVVISGTQKLIDWLREHAKPEIFAPEKSAVKPRMKFIPLSVSAPFHCRLMKPAEEEMRAVLSDIPFEFSQWPIVQNFTAEPTSDGDILRENLVRQVSGAVRWTQCMARMKTMGVKHYIEFGAGKVLNGLAKKIDSAAVPPFNINGLDDLNVLEKAIKETLK